MAQKRRIRESGNPFEIQNEQEDHEDRDTSVTEEATAFLTSSMEVQKATTQEERKAVAKLKKREGDCGCWGGR